MSEPFLPELEAPPPSPAQLPSAKRYGWRALLLWVVLIVMFLTIWQFLTPGTDGEQVAKPIRELPSSDAPPSSGPWSLFGLVPWLLFIGVTWYWVRSFRHVASFSAAQEPARLAMAQGRFAEAADLFRASLVRFPKQLSYRAQALMNVAEAQLRAGRFDDVFVACREVERTHLGIVMPGYRMRTASITVVAYALRGDVPLAERWIAEGQARLRKHQDDRLLAVCWLCLGEAILACRKNDPERASALLEERWTELRYVLSADMMRIVELVRAFAESQGSTRAQNTVAERLIRVEPVAPGEFAFLGIEWPEMRVFLETSLPSSRAA